MSTYDRQIKQASLNSIRLETIKCGMEGLPPASSRIGGQPALPRGFVWPKWNGKSQSFIAQINLSEMAPYDVSRLLPSKGILYFFYDQEQSTWGFDPRDRGSWFVSFYDGDIKDLSRADFPGDLAEEAQYQPCKLKCKKQNTLPPYESLFIESLSLSDQEQDAYFKMLDEAHPDSDIAHRLLGHPDVIQNEMQTECELVTNGLYCGDSSGYQDPKAAELRKAADNWMLLLQIDSDENAGMMWGDVGRLYFWIRKDDLAHQRFDKVWMILQCC